VKAPLPTSGLTGGQTDHVKVDLAESQWVAVSHGEILGPDGRTWRRRSTKTARSECDRLVSTGSAFVLYYFAGGQLDWFDGDDAAALWPEVRKAVVTAARRKGDLEWTAGIWVDNDEESILLLTGHC
jgi:hypothetical protein